MQEMTTVEGIETEKDLLILLKMNSTLIMRLRFYHNQI